MSKSTNYSVEGNYFTNIPGSATTWSWGIAIRASGPFANVIKNNVFEKITVGIIPEGQNANPNDVYKTGLKYRCNLFVRGTIKHSDILLVDGSISREQGECLGNDPSAPAGNLFSHSSTLPSSHFDINIYPGVVPLGYSINYYHHLVTSNRYIFLLRVSEIATGATANYVFRSQCNAAFNSERGCDEGPIPTFTENAIEGMETKEEPSVLDVNSILSVPNLFETNILELEK